MLKFYYNPECAKCNAALKYLRDKSIVTQVIQYLKSPFTQNELDAALLKMDKSASEMIKTSHPIYKERIEGKELSERELLKIMVLYPQIIECPIVVSKYKAVLADPPERIEELLRND